MNERDILLNILFDFHTKPGRMSVEDMKTVHKFYSDYQEFVELSLLATYGELTPLNKIGVYNENKMKIEKAGWYIDYLTSKELPSD